MPPSRSGPPGSATAISLAWHRIGEKRTSRGSAARSRAMRPRHEVFYTKIVAELFERDPEPTLLAYRNMLKRLIAMPGSRMTDGQDLDLFGHYASVAQRTGVYTSMDYA